MSYTTPSSHKSFSLIPLSQTLHNLHEKKERNHPACFILDGGTGEELFRNGVPDDRKIWSATAIVHSKYHKILKQVHQSYIKAGSNAITTNSYGIVPGVGFSVEDVVKYTCVAGQLARDAVSETVETRNTDKESTSNSFRSNNEAINELHIESNKISPNTFILGSLGPLVESYRPDLIMDHSKGTSIYSKMINALHPFVDAIIGETMSCVNEALQIVDAYHETLPIKQQQQPIPLLLSFTLNQNGHFRDGESVVNGINRVIEYITTTVYKISSQPQIINPLHAILFNCCEPEAITTALKEISENEPLQRRLKKYKILLGAYAHRLTPIAENWSLETSTGAQAMRCGLSPRDYYHDFVKVWINDLGVQIIGGCCGIAPQHIAYISKEIKCES